ncbi:MAG: AbrB/MazE/SpoVT family DNA-binding domain-containing protein [Terracidiphilus sp.]|jgi:bifunctional DNA-binding transcriptional regulator/antitoxin component of YhaV-PrlF toxin-antitoxin module
MGQMGTISSKGQLVIPVELRAKYNLRPRAKVVFGEENGKLTVESTALDDVLALRGCLSHVKEDVEAWWMEEKRKEREREDARIEEFL